MALRRANFTGADLSEAKLISAYLENAILRDAKLERAHLAGANCTEVDASGADLRGAKMWESDWTDANLQNANLEGAIFNELSMLGTDLTGANLTGIAVDGSTYDAKTRFPEGYVPDRHWSGPPLPMTGQAPVAVQLTFESFFSRLPSLTEPGRLQNAISMLRAERFQLFAEVEDGSVIGIVRSQSVGQRVYACRLTSTGQYECGTQNLRPCGGLQGKVCKHLLVLILGLTRVAKLDPGKAHLWLNLAQRQGPTFNKGTMTATFLKYQGIEVGEVDWRPTETIPEDYYAL
jgi:hypothetical protein